MDGKETRGNCDEVVISAIENICFRRRCNK